MNLLRLVAAFLIGQPPRGGARALAGPSVSEHQHRSDMTQAYAPSLVRHVTLAASVASVGQRRLVWCGPAGLRTHQVEHRLSGRVSVVSGQCQVSRGWWLHDDEQHFLDEFQMDRHGAG